MYVHTHTHTHTGLEKSGLGLIANIMKGLGVGGGGGGGVEGGKAAFEAGVKAAKTFYNGYKDAQVLLMCC